MKIDPLCLSRLLYEEFSRDEWGDIDPVGFRHPETYDNKFPDGFNPEIDYYPKDMAGVYDVLKRVCDRINGRKNHLICPKCASTDTYETYKIQSCRNCGFTQDYHNWNHNEPDFQ